MKNIMLFILFWSFSFSQKLHLDKKICILAFDNTWSELDIKEHILTEKEIQLSPLN